MQSGTEATHTHTQRERERERVKSVSVGLAEGEVVSDKRGFPRLARISLSVCLSVNTRYKTATFSVQYSNTVR